MASFKSLNQGQLLSWKNSSHLTVLSGELWVTIEGNRTDYILGKGDSIPLDLEMLIVAEALQPSQIVILEKHPNLNLADPLSQDVVGKLRHF